MAHHNEPKLARRALVQALGLGLMVLVAVGIVLWQARQPADIDQVAIAVGEVRSHSAELALLAGDGGRILTPRFARAHAGQLQRGVVQTRDEVASLHPQATLAEPVEALHTPLRDMQRELESVQQAGLPAIAASAAAARARTERLAQQEQALQR
jgi:hypothetical protein